MDDVIQFWDYVDPKSLGCSTKDELASIIVLPVVRIERHSDVYLLQGESIEAFRKRLLREKR